MGSFNLSRRLGVKWILIVKDVFFKWVEVFFIIKVIIYEVVRVLEKDIFARYGFFDFIYSD